MFVEKGLPLRQGLRPSHLALGQAPIPLGRRQVETLGILANHAVGVEGRTDGSHGSFHASDPLVRKPVGVAVVEQRNDLFLQDSVDGPGFDSVLIVEIFVQFASADSPAGVGLVSLSPPAINGAHVYDAVGGGLHPAGAAGLAGAKRGIEPYVCSLKQVAGHGHIVVFNEDHASSKLLLPAETNHLLDQLLAWVVLGMRFSCEDDLNGAGLVVQYPGQPIWIAQDQGGAFVGGEPAAESDGQGFRVQHFARFLYLGWGSTPLLELPTQAPSNKGYQSLPPPLVGAPKLLVGNLIHPRPYALVRRAF